MPPCHRQVFLIQNVMNTAQSQMFVTQNQMYVMLPNLILFVLVIGATRDDKYQHVLEKANEHLYCTAFTTRKLYTAYKLYTTFTTHKL